MQKFNPYRFVVAKQRRKINGGDLARLAGLNQNTFTRLKNGNDPKPETVEAIAKALKYPVEFFYMPTVEVLSKDEVSFRSLSRMTAIDRDAAISAGSLGMLLWDWIEERFDLPKSDTPDFRDASPEEAAILLRQRWSLGEKPIPDIIKLLESKGVRVLSLCESTKHVDAFSFYKDGQPYVFLNNFKTPEHSVYDTAHELGHLVLHRHAELSKNKQVESEANRFAAAFLIPRADLRAKAPRRITTQNIIKLKKRWRVSAMALARSLKDIGRLSDWQYKSLCIDLSQLGYRSSEPDGIERLKSFVIQHVLETLWQEKVTTRDIASDLNVPVEELDKLLFNLTEKRPRPDKERPHGLSLV